MSAVATVVATGVSLGALGWLSATDPKRRRTFGIKAGPQPAPRWAWALVLVPGVLVPFWSGAAGFVLWLGAVSVVGWALVAVPPGRMPALDRWLVRGAHLAEAAGRRLGGLAQRLRLPGVPEGWAVASARRGTGVADDARLEARLAALEAEVAALRAALEQAPVRAELHLVEGARGGGRRAGLPAGEVSAVGA